MSVRRYDGSGLVMSREGVRGVDLWAIDEMQIPGVVLMENAGRGCAEVVLERLGDGQGREVCIFCGTGNNGGDGFVIGRHLFNNGVGVRFVVCGDSGRSKAMRLLTFGLLN